MLEKPKLDDISTDMLLLVIKYKQTKQTNFISPLQPYMYKKKQICTYFFIPIKTIKQICIFFILDTHYLY